MANIGRRGFINLGLGTALAAYLNLPAEASARKTASKRATEPPKTKNDISYIWHKDLEAVLDYKTVIGEVIGPLNAKKLRIVKGSENYGLIEDVNLEPRLAERLAKQRSADLVDSGFEPAIAIEDTGYDRVYNVSYGKGPNLDELKKRFADVYSQLGKDLGRDLVIEHVGQEYALVYQRRGDKENTFAAAKRQEQLLAPLHIPASIIAEDNNKVVYHEADYINITEIEPELESRTPSQRAKKPKSTQSDLEDKVRDVIKKLRDQGTLKSTDKVSFYAYDLKNDEEFLSINQDTERQCASMFKPYVALAYFHKVAENKLKYTSRTKRSMELMLANSNNGETNSLIDQVGGARGVQAVLDKYPQIFKGTKIVERIPEGGRTYKNKSTATDYARFMEALWDNKFPYAKEIRRMMAGSIYNRVFLPHKMSSGTAKYTKTGTTGLLVGDFGIIAPKEKDGGRHPYIIVGIVERPEKKGANWSARGAKTIRAVSGEVYAYMKQKYNLA